MPEFAQFFADIRVFQATVLHRMQTFGQVPFLIDHADLKSVEVLNGLAAYLDVEDRLDQIDQNLKVQNPLPMSEKVANFDEMEATLAGTDPFSLNRVPDFEPGRIPAVPTYVTGVRAPVVKTWMANLKNVPVDALQTKMPQKDLRTWKKRAQRHRSFTV